MRGVHFAGDLRRLHRETRVSQVEFGEDNLQGTSAAVIEGLVMPERSGQIKLNRTLLIALVALAPALPLAACQKETDTAAPTPRPVRTTTVEKRQAGQPLTFTGRIEAEDEVSLAFRISGRLLENSGKLGDRVQAGQIMARLEPQNELNALRQAQAGLAAAQGN